MVGQGWASLASTAADPDDDALLGLGVVRHHRRRGVGAQPRLRHDEAWAGVGGGGGALAGRRRSLKTPGGAPHPPKLVCFKWLTDTELNWQWV